MSLEIYVTDAATEDALAVAEYLAGQAGFDTSDKFLGATTQAYRQLAEFPGLGSPRDYGPQLPGLRLWPVPGFRPGRGRGLGGVGRHRRSGRGEGGRSVSRTEIRGPGG